MSPAFQKALRQTQRLAMLIDSLLDASQITAGNLRLDAEAVNLVEIARSAIERYAEEAQQRLRAAPARRLPRDRSLGSRADRGGRRQPALERDRICARDDHRRRRRDLARPGLP